MHTASCQSLECLEWPDPLTMALQGFNLETLAGIHSDEFSRIIKSLQGLAYTRRGPMPTHAPPAPNPQG